VTVLSGQMCFGEIMGHGESRLRDALKTAVMRCHCSTFSSQLNEWMHDVIFGAMLVVDDPSVKSLFMWLCYAHGCVLGNVWDMVSLKFAVL